MTGNVTPIDAKLITNLAALAALAGFELHQLADGSFLLAKWNLVRPLADVHAVETFLASVEGRAA